MDSNNKRGGFLDFSLQQVLKKKKKRCLDFSLQLANNKNALSKQKNSKLIFMSYFIFYT